MAEYHPDKDALESFARGEILAAAERWIVDHIRSGCSICQRTVDALLPGLEGTVAPQFQPRLSSGDFAGKIPRRFG